MPLDLRTLETHDNGIDDDSGLPYFTAWDPNDDSAAFNTIEVTEEQFRLIGQFEAARERQTEAALAVAARSKPPREPEPEEIPTGGKLTPRQEEFCHRYAAQPVATRAAALAGYAEVSAHNQGHRLLKNPLVLDRIAAIRAERNLRYVLEADTLHDKLEALFFDAIGEGNHSAAIAALRLQAALGGLLATRDDGSVRSEPKRAAKPKSGAKIPPPTRNRRRRARNTRRGR